jgi:hypothetical protein
MSLPSLHMFAIALWTGVLAAEGVLEFLPLKRPELHAAAAAFHYSIDLLIELPLLIVIALTGVLLLRGTSFDARLIVKVAAGALAVLVNLICVVVVVIRHRGAPEQIERRTRRIYLLIAIGSPGYLLALVLGLGYAGWLD